MEPFQLIQLPSQENKTSLDTYVGIIHELNSPFHLYINISQLGLYDYIKIIIYSIGAKKEIIWGIYDLNEYQFEFESACKYTLKQLLPFIRQWENVGYEYIANAVTDRIHLAMASFNPGNKELTREEYKILKYLVAYLEDKVTEQEFEEVDPDNTFLIILQKIGISNTQEISLSKFLEQNLNLLKKKLKEYEKHINRIDIDKDVLRNNRSSRNITISSFRILSDY